MSMELDGSIIKWVIGGEIYGYPDEVVHIVTVRISYSKLFWKSILYFAYLQKGFICSFL